MNTTVLQTAALRALRTFAQAFVAALVASQAEIGVTLSPLHALELAGIAGLAALVHNLPPETIPGIAPAASHSVSFTPGIASTQNVVAFKPAGPPTDPPPSEQPPAA
jgi:hypothetical protein